MAEQILSAIFYAVTSIIIGTGIILYLIANKIPPNPFLGFRIGYAYVSRSVWVKLNRIAGLIFTLVGLLTIVESFFINYEVVLLLLPIQLIVATILLVEYAERIAERELIKIPEGKEEKLEPIKPFYPHILHIIVPIAMLVAFVYFAITLYPQLPEKVAVHFNIHDIPNRYGSKTEVLATIIAAPAMVYTLLFFFIYLGVKKPVAFYKPWFKPQIVYRIVNILYTLLAVVAVTITLALIDVLYYNVYGEHVLPVMIIGSFTTVVILGLTLYLVVIVVMSVRKRKIIVGKNIGV